ncbi:hypothetical protein [Stenomitos frigidus]|uniref:Serine protease n=1 Tax=Stenomitos frigidus ULC18 TaxID=2107698 RepID=A0A2T1DZS4_9CYAN|nr:hypothetical protein [Stenomitos frigidus]PSB25998.1 hypothetical protein C7B82_21080 [Stenomitos frigidus ULC18]
MKFKSLLLFFTPSVLLYGSAAVGLPLPSIAQVAAGTSATPANAYHNCQQAANAVVTLYSGSEIGAGSIVDADATILTALHVVKEAVKCQVVEWSSLPGACDRK